MIYYDFTRFGDSLVESLTSNHFKGLYTKAATYEECLEMKRNTLR